jgi:LmbE family N-acetylglucosaminyl deacetylase
MRAAARWINRLLLRCVLRERPAATLGLPAVVFAPHPDDETLGCGGTIVRKRRAGARVALVFLTDGSASHPGLIKPEELRERRAAEAVAAARVLGVSPGDVSLLGFPDGRLSGHEEEAARRVAEILGRERPAEVFVPYRRDGPPDHEAATRIVLAALRAAGVGATVCEYPIWFWHYWPWTGSLGRGRQALHRLRVNLRATGELLRRFRWCVRVGGVLDVKRRALAEHRSQMEHLVPDPAYVTLGDVAGGDFLARFFEDREIFHVHGPDRL